MATQTHNCTAHTGDLEEWRADYERRLASLEAALAATEADRDKLRKLLAAVGAVIAAGFAAGGATLIS